VLFVEPLVVLYEVCGVASMAKGERGPHWPKMLAAGIYAVFFGITP
jgi:hypothetical protein